MVVSDGYALAPDESWMVVLDNDVLGRGVLNEGKVGDVARDGLE
jgi:hypothetical protein